MKVRKENSHSRSHPGLFPLLTACALALSVGVQDVVRGNGSSSDETVGGLPGRGGWDGSGSHEFDARPGFYLVGSAADILASIVTIEGEGYEQAVEHGSEGLVRYEFYGDLEITLDAAQLERREVEMGVLASHRVGVKARLSWDGGDSPLFTLDEGARFELPLERMRDLGLLERSLAVATYNRVTGRSRFQVEDLAGHLRLTSRH